MLGEFSVLTFYSDETYELVLRFVNAETAMKAVRDLVLSPAAKSGAITRVLIIDGGDFCNFDWKHGEGIVFPPLEPTK